MGYFSHEEWSNGTLSFSSASSYAELRDRLGAITASTRRDASALRSLHSYTHKFCRVDDRARTIDVRRRFGRVRRQGRDVMPAAGGRCDAISTHVTVARSPQASSALIMLKLLHETSHPAHVASISAFIEEVGGACLSVPRPTPTIPLTPTTTSQPHPTPSTLQPPVA